MRKIVLNLAMSLDGYICDVDGGYEWIKGHGNHSLDSHEKFDINTWAESIDTIVMGRVSLEDCGIDFIKDSEHKKILVATNNPNYKTQFEHIEFIHGDIVKHVVNLKNNEAGKDIWLFGGARLVEKFIENDVIDEYIIGIIPVLLGSGRRLFHDFRVPISLVLDKTYIDDGMVILKYHKA